MKKLPTKMDNKSKEQRRLNMSKVRSTDTRPERFLRKALFAKGFRYGKNVKTLPGCPDMVFRKFKAVILVNGCFWHGHENCKKAKIPSTNTQFWKKKIKYNKERDIKNLSLLQKSGWRVLIVWTCSLANKISRNRTVQATSTWLVGSEKFMEISES